MQVCQKCQSKFEIAQEEISFYDKISPVFKGKKYLVPAPLLCPECREKRRICWQNVGFLYRRLCDKTKELIISIYPPDSKYLVYSHDAWFGDDFSDSKYGIEFNFNKTFTEQFADLTARVPRLALVNSNSENCDYCNFIDRCKDCYMSFMLYHNSEDCLYAHWGMEDKDCADISISNKLESCYECLQCLACYKCFFCYRCHHSDDCYFSADLHNCSHCFFCKNLSRKQYCIFNEQYTKEEYARKIQEIGFNSQASLSKCKAQYKELINSMIAPASFKINCEDCVGDDLINCKDAHHCFLSHDLDWARYCFGAGNDKCVMDMFSTGYNEWCYEINSIGYSSNCLFCVHITESSSLFYCDTCGNCHDCFGCIGLQHKQYCILNKQYSKQEYEELVPRIIEHMMKTKEWGEFFHPSLSPFGYNETVAQEYFPLAKEQALEQGFNWSDYEAPFPKVEKIIKADELDRDQKFLIPENNDILN
ncbi:MAG: hypothetical protein NTZ80_00605, partial [Patescibacteria group bacterium]|nr:hypothetical protein [Patescibacteria group bacterium]